MADDKDGQEEAREEETQGSLNGTIVENSSETTPGKNVEDRSDPSVADASGEVEPGPVMPQKEIASRNAAPEGETTSMETAVAKEIALPEKDASLKQTEEGGTPSDDLQTRVDTSEVDEPQNNEVGGEPSSDSKGRDADGVPAEKKSASVEQRSAKPEEPPPPRGTCHLRSNDTRRCQKRFRELIGRSSVRNEQLEKKEGDLRQRMEMLECSMPAVMVWNIWRMSQGAPVPSIRRIIEKHFQDASSDLATCPSTPSRHYDCRVREVESERKEAQRRAEEARAILTEKEKSLEEQSRRILEAKKIQEQRKEEIERLIQEVTNAKKETEAEEGKSCTEGECGALQCRKAWVEKVTSGSSMRSTDLDCLIRLQELAESELCTKRQIAELERRECAYMRTLQQADELWSKMAGDTASTLSTVQEQLEQKVVANQRLAERVCELEDQLESLKKRLVGCRTELSKYVDAEQVDAVTGGDEDLAETADVGTSAGATVAEKAALAVVPAQEKSAGPTRDDLDQDDSSEDDDYPGSPCSPSFVCEGVVTERYDDDLPEGAAPKSPETPRPKGIAEATAPEAGVESRGREEEAAPISSPEIIVAEVPEDLRADVSTEPDEALLADAQMERKQTVDQSVGGEGGEDVAEVDREAALRHLAQEEEGRSSIGDIARAEGKHVEVLAEALARARTAKHEGSQAGEDLVQVPRAELLSWIDTTDGIAKVISKCSVCSAKKPDAVGLSESMRALAKIEIPMDEIEEDSTGEGLRQDADTLAVVSTKSETTQAESGEQEAIAEAADEKGVRMMVTQEDKEPSLVIERVGAEEEEPVENKGTVDIKELDRKEELNRENVTVGEVERINGEITSIQRSKNPEMGGKPAELRDLASEQESKGDDVVSGKTEHVEQKIMKSQKLDGEGKLDEPSRLKEKTDSVQRSEEKSQPEAAKNLVPKPALEQLEEVKIDDAVHQEIEKIKDISDFKISEESGKPSGYEKSAQISRVEEDKKLSDVDAVPREYASPKSEVKDAGRSTELGRGIVSEEPVQLQKIEKKAPKGEDIKSVEAEGLKEEIGDDQRSLEIGSARPDKPTQMPKLKQEEKLKTESIVSERSEIIKRDSKDIQRLNEVTPVRKFEPKQELKPAQPDSRDIMPEIQKFTTSIKLEPEDRLPSIEIASVKADRVSEKIKEIEMGEPKSMVQRDDGTRLSSTETVHEKRIQRKEGPRALTICPSESKRLAEEPLPRRHPVCGCTQAVLECGICKSLKAAEQKAEKATTTSSIEVRPPRWQEYPKDQSTITSASVALQTEEQPPREHGVSKEKITEESSCECSGQDRRRTKLIERMGGRKKVADDIARTNARLRQFLDAARLPLGPEREIRTVKYSEAPTGSRDSPQLSCVCDSNTGDSVGGSFLPSSVLVPYDMATPLSGSWRTATSPTLSTKPRVSSLPLDQPIDQEFRCCPCKEPAPGKRSHRSKGPEKPRKDVTKTSCDREVCCDCLPKSSGTVPDKTQPVVGNVRKSKPVMKDECCLAKIPKPKDGSKSRKPHLDRGTDSKSRNSSIPSASASTPSENQASPSEVFHSGPIPKNSFSLPKESDCACRTKSSASTSGEVDSPSVDGCAC